MCQLIACEKCAIAACFPQGSPQICERLGYSREYSYFNDGIMLINLGRKPLRIR